MTRKIRTCKEHFQSSNSEGKEHSKAMSVDVLIKKKEKKEMKSAYRLMFKVKKTLF